MKHKLFRKLIRKYLLGTAIVVAIAAGLALLWDSLRLRTITVCVVSDFSFRDQRPSWHELLDTRFEAVNRIFGGTGVHWDFRQIEQPDPTGDLTDLEERRRALVRTQCEADIVLGISGHPGIESMGDVPAFAHTAIVADRPADSVARNTLRLAQALASLFGAPTDPRGAGTLMTDPPESEVIPKPVLKLIARLKWYDFARGAAALDGRWGDRAYSALLDAWSGHAANPARAARHVLGTSLGADRSFPAAIRQFVEVVKLDPGSPEAHTELANLYTHDSQTNAALPEYRAAVRLAPASAAQHAALGIGLANAGAEEEGLQELREALRIEPRHATAQVALAYILSHQLGRTDEAITAYGAALDLDPSLPQAIEGLGRAHALKDQAAGALVEARNRVQAAPSDSSAHLSLGLAEAQAGNVGEAITELQRAVKLDNSNGLAHLNLAILLSGRQQYTAALQEAEAATRFGFDPPPAMLESLRRKAGR